jgi:hypothetical protein
MIETGKKLRAQRFVRFLCALAISLSLTVCSRNVPPPDAATLLQNLPAGDPAKYPNLRQVKHWGNPYLVVRSDGIGLVTSINAHEERILKPDEVLDVLAQLPPSAWPYGRVVAILVDARPTSSEQDKIAIRRNRGIVAGELQGAHVAIEWQPGAGAWAL